MSEPRPDGSMKARRGESIIDITADEMTLLTKIRSLTKLRRMHAGVREVSDRRPEDRGRADMARNYGMRASVAHDELISFVSEITRPAP